MAKQVYSKEQIKNMIVNEALAQGVDPRLALALAKQESGYNAYARSKVGAIGIMQLMPNTAKGLGVKDPYDPQQNVRGGIKLLKGLVGKYGNDTKRVLAAYNAGSGAVDDYLYGTNKTGQNPRLRKNAMPYDGTGYKETKGYVNNILSMINNVNSEINRFAEKHPVLSSIYKYGTPMGTVGRITDTALKAGQAAVKGYYDQKGGANQAINPNNTATGEAAELPEQQSMSGYDLLNSITIPDTGITTPTINPYSGIATNVQAQNLLAALPSQYEQDKRDYMMGYITPQQFYAMHSNELAKEGINSPEDLVAMPRWTPQALNEVNKAVEANKITPEQIQQVQENYNQEIAKQREMATQQGQGMVDRLNQLQQQYDAIINSDPRLQTGQGYYIDPDKLARQAIGSTMLANLGKDPRNYVSYSDIQNAMYNAQRSNELGVPYTDYLEAKKDAIKNQMTALQQYQQLQDNINTNQAGMVNELSKVVQKANELGIGALTANEKEILDLYGKVLPNMVTAEGNIQEKMYERPMQITNANLNTRGNIYDIDTRNMTDMATNAATVGAQQEGNRLNFYNQHFRNLIEQQNAPFKNAYEAANAAAAATTSGYNPTDFMSIFGLNMPTTNIPTQQPKQGLNWGG